MRSPWLIALFDPSTLLMIPLSILAGLFAAWWLFPVGILLWFIMALVIALNPGVRLNTTIGLREPLSSRFQTPFNRISRAQVSLFNALAGAPLPVRRALQPVQDAVKELVDEIYLLCRRMTPLENFRQVTQSSSAVQFELERLAEKIAAAKDPIVKREYEQAQQALQTRLDKFTLVCNQLDRVDAQLSSMGSELEGILSESIRMQSLGEEYAARQAPQISQKLRQEINELRQFQQEIADV